MSPDEFADAGRRLVGASHGWVQRYAALLGINYDNVRKMLSGKRPIPSPRAAQIQALLAAAPAREAQPVAGVIRPPPATLGSEADRDGPCGDAIEPVLDALAEAAERAGWNPAEVASAVLGWVVHRMADGAGQDAALAALDDAAEVVRLRGG